VRLSPLQGEGYVYLAELQRWHGDSPVEARALMRQALRVRPHSSDVLLAAGAERATAGDLAEAVGCWREAFRSGRDEQNRLAPMLAANHIPVDVILKEFEPDLDATRLLDAKYTAGLSDKDAQTLLQYYLESAQAATKTVSSEGAASLWIEIEGIYGRLGKPAEALRCLRRAAAARPSDLTLRTALAKRLFLEHEYAEAEMHFKWRLQRSPDDAQIQAMLSETQRMLRLESTTAGVPRPATR
jgi:tetratricopeptide (TPR) repeat protein